LGYFTTMKLYLSLSAMGLLCPFEFFVRGHDLANRLMNFHHGPL